jgi:hypothetical protein
MYILSKYKDYYDYLIGIYGVDDRLVLDRTQDDVPTYTGFISFYICGKRIDGYFDVEESKYYFGKDLLTKFPDATIGYRNKNKWFYNLLGQSKDSTSDEYILIHPKNGRTIKVYYGIIDDFNDNNTKLSCPILSQDFGGILFKYPKLIDTGISKVLSPQEIYLMLCEWIGQEKPLIDNRTNEEKILSAGFDKKISFRNIK